MCWPLFSGAPRMSCGVNLLDLRRKRMMCLKVVAYTGKFFREDGLSDVDFFLPLAMGKGAGACNLAGGTTEHELPWEPSLSSQNQQDSSWFLTTIPTCCVLVLLLPPEWCPLLTHCDGLEKLSFCSDTAIQRALAEDGGRKAQQMPCESVWSMMQLPLVSDRSSFTWKLNCWEGEEIIFHVPIA